MRDLLLMEALVCLVSFLLAWRFFEDHPPTPPSYSTQLRDEGVDVYSSQDSADPDSRAVSSSRAEGMEKIKRQVHELMANRDYVILLVAFSTGLGLFNTFLTLIYQIVEPYGYRCV